MEAPVRSAVSFSLRGDAVEIIPIVDPSGGVQRLTYRADGEEWEFAGEEIANALSPRGTRLTVLLEDGAADGPIVALSVILPIIEAPHEGPFDVTAAALITTTRSLFGGVRPGPQQSYEVVALSGTASCDERSTIGACRDWSAVHDKEPPGPFTLRVTGACTMPTPGYTVELCRHEPQGIDPRDLLLDRVVTPPTGIQPQVLDTVDVRFEEQTDADYDTVTILPDGPTIEVVEAF
ncbi:MAG: hypothetical protein ACRDLN_12565 [Solirubrobacteraceae bacterium]